MKQCQLCNKEVKYSKFCRSCSNKEARKIWPKLFENIENKLCDFGCGQIAKYIFKNGSIGCSKGQQYCKEVCRKNSENTKGKPSGMLGKHHSEKTKKIIKQKNIESGRIIWNKGLTKETDERIKRISEFHIGKIITEETRFRISIAIKNSEKMKKVKDSKEYREKLSKSLTGRIITDDAKRNMSIGRRNSEKLKQVMKSNEYRSKMSESHSGSKNGNYKGLDRTWASYDTTKKHLIPIEEVKQDPDNKNILNVRCSYCNKWYRPTVTAVMNRTLGLNSGTCKFYCSEECKDLCSDYGQIIYPKGFKKQHQGEVDSTLRKLVFERDEWKCQKCGNEIFLECHHIDPVSLKPILSNDIDSCITLCKECHKWIHMNISGCGYYELSKEKENQKDGCK